MKRIHLLLGVLVMILVSCSSEQNTYEKTIADFMQTDKRGTKYDMKFKVLEFKEIKRMTVADSIQLLDAKKKKQQATKIAYYEKLLSKDKAKFEAAKKSKKTVDKIFMSSYKKSVAYDEAELKKWKEWNPNWTEAYQNLPKDKLLSIIVYCKYSAVPPMMNTTIEEVRYFVLSGDGKKCYRRMKDLK